MWIFTKEGFYSAVEDRNDAGLVIVRARTRRDIVSLARRLEVRAFASAKGADYPYRLWASKLEWAEYLAQSAEEIDYPNFKSEMEKHFDSKRMDQLHEVWAVMADFGWEW